MLSIRTNADDRILAVFAAPSMVAGADEVTREVVHARKTHVVSANKLAGEIAGAAKLPGKIVSAGTVAGADRVASADEREVAGADYVPGELNGEVTPIGFADERTGKDTSANKVVGEATGQTGGNVPSANKIPREGSGVVAGAADIMSEIPDVCERVGGSHASPLAGRARTPMALTDVVAWARAMRARSAPS